MTPDLVFPAEHDREQVRLSNLMSAINDERDDSSRLRSGCREDCGEHGTFVQLIAGALNAPRNTQVEGSLGSCCR
jgi:hypothetical protein